MITQNIDRVANFTSSQIYRLCGFDRSGKQPGKPFFEYIAEKAMEHRLKRSLDSEVSSRITSWGKFVEQRVFNLLGTDYNLCSTETIKHPDILHWSGSPDGLKFGPDEKPMVVYDIKCPSSLKSFCELVDGCDITKIRDTHKDGDKYYWQLVSNAILTGVTKAELIVYVPYQRELAEIREETSNYEGDQNKIAWINWAQDEDLPFLIEGAHYKNINIISFDVPSIDIDFLTERVKQASAELVTLINQ